MTTHKRFQDPVLERLAAARWALSATWRSEQKTAPAEVKARRMRATDENLLPGIAHHPSLGLSHAGNSFGGLTRRARDSVPPREIVTEQVFPNPQPDRPGQNASSAQIRTWNLRMLALEPKDRPYPR